MRLPDLRGDSVALRSLVLAPDSAVASRVTLVNLWATWCEPCREEIPRLVALEDSLRAEGLRVVGIAVESGSPRAIRRFADSLGVDYPILTAGQEWVRRTFTVFGLPATLVVDGRGLIRWRLPGPQETSAFRAAIEAVRREGLVEPAGPRGGEPGGPARAPQPP